MSEQAAPQAPGLVDKAVAEGGAYEVLHKRLQEQGRQVRQQAETLNQQRLQAFGDSRMEVAGRVRIRTENNCVARDIVQVELRARMSIFWSCRSLKRLESGAGT